METFNPRQETDREKTAHVWVPRIAAAGLAATGAAVFGSLTYGRLKESHNAAHNIALLKTKNAITKAAMLPDGIPPEQHEKLQHLIKNISNDSELHDKLDIFVATNNEYKASLSTFKNHSLSSQTVSRAARTAEEVTKTLNVTKQNLSQKNAATTAHELLNDALKAKIDSPESPLKWKVKTATIASISGAVIGGVAFWVNKVILEPKRPTHADRIIQERVEAEVQKNR